MKKSRFLLFLTALMIGGVVLCVTFSSVPLSPSVWMVDKFRYRNSERLVVELDLPKLTPTPFTEVLGKEEPSRNHIHVNHLPGNMTREEFCSYDCRDCFTTKPSVYQTEVDFRIIPIAFTRAESLRKCLQPLYELDTMGDIVVVDIWIDRSKAGIIDAKTYTVALEFAISWKKGYACVYNQTKNAYINGQWIYTWRPPPSGKELALIIEDDNTISPYAYRWIKGLHNQYKNWDNISGYSLQSENVQFYGNPARQVHHSNKDILFMNQVFGTWGFAPHPKAWSTFQDWYLINKPNTALKPYIPNLLLTNWFKNTEKDGSQESMWGMWHIYYVHMVKPEWCVYSNLVAYLGRSDARVATNRRESGLHFRAHETIDQRHLLLRTWDDSYLTFPARPVMYSPDGKINLNT